MLAAERKQETMRRRYHEIEVKVVENGYKMDAIYWEDDNSSFILKYLLPTRADLDRFLYPLLELGTEKAGEEPEEWNHV